jgi:type VI secretion system (T6SS) baseplate-like injector VgrG
MSPASLDFLSDPPELDDEEEPKRFYGVVTGRVINLIDLMQLGRVQVQLPFIDDIDLSPWARIAVPMSGIVSGVAFLPQIGDEVLVAFEHGDVNVPYVIGSLWNGLAPPPPNIPPDSPIRTSYMIRTLTGNGMMIVEAPPMLSIMAPVAGQTMTMTPAGTAIVSATAVEIVVAGATILVTPAGVQIAGATVSLAATTALNLTAPAITIAAEGDCLISGEMVIINPV